jgi:hypothetical protein
MQLSFSQYHLETKNHDNEHMMIMDVCLQKSTTKHKTMTTNASWWWWCIAFWNIIYETKDYADFTHDVLYKF